MPDSTAITSSVERNQELIDACIEALNNVLVAYESVKDTYSADAAADRLEDLHRKMQMAVDKVNAIGETDEATNNLFMTRLLPFLFVSGSRITTASDSIKANDYYGSEKLRHFMEVKQAPQN